MLTTIISISALIIIISI